MPDYLAQAISTADGFFGLLDPYLGTIKFISAIISLLLFTGIVILIVKLNYIAAKVKQYKEMLEVDMVSKQRTVKIWNHITAELNSGDESKRKLAVIEADKVLDEILKLSGYKGENMSDRLKQITVAQVENIEDIWIAHRIRNQIAHQTGFELTEESARRAIGIYEKAFRQFGLLD